MKKKLLVLSLAVVMVFVFAACGDNTGSTEQRVWKFAHSGFEGDPLYEYGVALKEAIETEFPDVTLDVYPAEQLGNDDERFELAQSGGAEIAMVATCFIGNIMPEAEVFGLTYMIPTDREVANKIFAEGKAAGKIKEKMHDLGVTSMDWFQEGHNCWSSNKAIRTVDDMKGQNIRCMNTTMDIANVEGTGAIATPITFSEVYSALQLGTADGQGNPIATFVSKKFYEVQKYLTLTYHEVVVDTMVCNNDFYDGLSEEEQVKLAKCFKKANEVAAASVDQTTNDALATVKDAGVEVIELNDSEMGKFRETSKYAQRKFVKVAGKEGEEILDLLLSDLETYDK